MSTDEDDTDKWRNPKRQQSSDDRALRSRRGASYKPRGVPIVKSRDSDPELTSPFDLLERDPDDEMQAVVQRSRRNSDDPATFADIVKLAVALTKERSANAARNAEAEVVLQGPHKAHRSTRRHLIAAVIAAGASIASAIAGARHAVEPPPNATEQCQHQIDRIDHELGELRAQQRTHP